MQYKSAAIIVAGLAAQQAAAFGWTDASSYSCPGNTNNQCSDSQKNGYDWSGLQTGDFDSYGSNKFSGFKCSDSFGKRDLLSKRGFQSKCITGDLDSHPSMSCGDNEGMSIDTMQISSSHDADIDCEYSMPDGSTCHETHSCSEGGSIFQNSQCGGAKSVTFKPGKNAPSGCSIGVHHVGFHCGPPSSTAPASVPPTSSSVPAPSSSAPASSYGCTGPTCSSSVSAPASSSAPACYGGDCSSSAQATSSSAPAPSSSAPAPSSSASAPSSSAPAPSYSSQGIPGYGSSSSPVSPGSSSAPSYPSQSPSSSSPVSPGSSSAPSYPSQSQGVPGYGSSSSPVSPGSSSAPSYPSQSASSSSPVSPGSSSAPSYPSQSQSVPAPGSSSSQASPESSSSAPPSYPTPNCPGLLPRCLNTWMYMSGCKDNADSNCFCGNEKFIKNVMGCISAWSGSDDETSAAASYLMGLCATHVSTNPAIITACPSTVKPSPTPVDVTPSSSAAPITSAPAPGNSAPCTTITYSSSVIIPATFSTGVSSGLTCPGSSITTSLITTVTVPQVHMSTVTITTGGTTTHSVGLGAGSPAPAAASTTAGASVAPYPTGASSAAPIGYGTTGTTFGTSVAAPSASGYAPVPATGAGVKTGFSLTGLLIGAIAAVAL